MNSVVCLLDLLIKDYTHTLTYFQVAHTQKLHDQAISQLNLTKA